MWERVFDKYPFLTPNVNPNPSNEGSNWESKLDTGIAAKRRHIEQHFVLSGIGKSWVVFRLAQVTTLYLSPNSPQIEGPSKLPI